MGGRGCTGKATNRQWLQCSGARGEALWKHRGQVACQWVGQGLWKGFQEEKSSKLKYEGWGGFGQEQRAISWQLPSTLLTTNLSC